MKAFWTAGAILIALLLQSAVSQVAPGQARILDPFLLVLVYCALTGGEVHGMLAGAASGWIQEIHFGGAVKGLTGLTRVVLGFGVGLAGGRFLLARPGARLLVLFVATLLDTLLLEGLAATFEVRLQRLSTAGLLTRGAVNAVVGATLYEIIDRATARLRRREARP
jgi:cell shape-determining protein MreD